MVTECVAILAISLCLVVVFIRAGHGDYAASVTPILAVPFVHLLALPVSWWTDSLFPALAPQSVVAFADIAAVVVSCLMIMSFSGKIRNRKNKKLYVVMLGGYNIILTCTFVHGRWQCFGNNSLENVPGPIVSPGLFCVSGKIGAVCA